MLKTRNALVRKHNHIEAYCHMTYRCREHGHEIRIWNSRDGVTPFAMTCREPGCGLEARHVDWQLDIYDPTYQLQPGDWYWRDGTQEEAEAIIRRRLEAYPPSQDYLAERGFATVEDFIQELARPGDRLSEFPPGWPQLDRVPEPAGREE